MAKLLKCQKCGKTDSTKEELDFEMVGVSKPVRKYYHKACLEQRNYEKSLATCQRCNLKDTVKDNMEFEVVGIKKPQTNYYHKSCWQEHQQEKEFKEQERIELDKLVEVVKSIYGAKSIPNNAYPYFQDLRNGTKFFGKYDYKYKQGYSYDLIAQTFEYCSDTIEYWNGRKNFNGLTNAIRYGMAIVCDKLQFIEDRNKEREKQKLQIERHIENVSEEDYFFESNYKKPSTKHTDITDFLDD